MSLTGRISKGTGLYFKCEALLKTMVGVCMSHVPGRQRLH